MTEREIDYFLQLSEHLGRATRYQFLAEYLGGQRIPELTSVKVPARLYGYSAIDPKFSKQNVAVIAFEQLRREDEANLFVTINHEQKSVPRTLLDELDADLKWGSSVPSERLFYSALGEKMRVLSRLDDAR